MPVTNEADEAAPNDRRDRITAEIVSTTGIDQELIRRVVHSFYERIRDDGVLGPIFESRIHDWATHLDRMCTFWSSVALMTGTYHGRPMEKHMRLPVDGRHFDRWLLLFEETAGRECQPAAAAHFIERARRIAESLEMGVASGSGTFLAKGERYLNEDLDLPEGAN